MWCLSYGCLRSAVDKLEEEDKIVRVQLRCPERVHVEQPPPIEQDGVSEKTGWWSGEVLYTAKCTPPHGLIFVMMGFIERVSHVSLTVVHL